MQAAQCVQIFSFVCDIPIRLTLTTPNMNIIVDILVFALAFLVASRLLPNIKMESAWATIPASIIYLISYKVLSWILTTILTVASLGLLSFLSFLLVPVAAVLAFWLTTKLVNGYDVQDTGSIVWGTIIVTVVSSLVRLFL
jgi:uncharacterized membrane protein YvlD (DUF360 family)